MTNKKWMKVKPSAKAKAARDQWNRRAAERLRVGSCLYCTEPSLLRKKSCLSIGTQVFRSRLEAAAHLGVSANTISRVRCSPERLKALGLSLVEIKKRTGRCAEHTRRAAVATADFRDRHPNCYRDLYNLRKGRTQALVLIRSSLEKLGTNSL